jgi:hypothetical protein
MKNQQLHDAWIRVAEEFELTHQTKANSSGLCWCVEFLFGGDEELANLMDARIDAYARENDYSLGRWFWPTTVEYFKYRAALARQFADEYK